MANSASSPSDTTIERLGALDSGGKTKFNDHLKQLVSELTKSTTDAAWYYQRSERAYNTRLCVWAGQHEDGKKHAAAIGRDAFPWEGASDQRPHTVDSTVNEQAMIMVQTFLRAHCQAIATNSDKLEWADQMTNFMKYMIWTRMRAQIKREIGLAVNWRQMYGASVTSVMWDQQLRRTTQEITVQGLAQMKAQSDDPRAIAAAQQHVLETIMDPNKEEEIVKNLRGMSPILKRGSARKCLKELRETGATEIPIPEVFSAMPRWQALLPMVDVFFPTSTDDIQRAPWVAHRELITESDLLDRVNTQGYDKDFVDAAIENKGIFIDSQTSSQLSYVDARQNFWGVVDADRKDLIEIFHYYRKSVDESGIPQVWNTVLCIPVTELVGLDEPFDYQHGQVPYVVHQREHVFRGILQSRGVPTIAESWQQEIKAQRDARTDRTSISVLPPIIVPPNRGNTKLPFGPGVKWPARNGQDPKMFEIPPQDGSSIEIEKAASADNDRYFGRISAEILPALTQLHQQDLADGWLLEVKDVVQMTIQLCRQYMTDAEATRIVGDLSFPWQTSNKELEAFYDVSIEFDPADLNPELLQQKLKMLQEVLPFDRFGQADYSKLFPLLLRAVDPILARATLQSMGQANQSQISDEQNALTQMVAGIEPPLQPQAGMNYPLRLQTLQQAIQANPELQQMIHARPVLQQMVQNRIKFLTFQQQQIGNAQIGRVGTAPVLNQPPGQQQPQPANNSQG